MAATANRLKRRIAEAVIYWLSGWIPRRQKLVVFGAWLGKRYADNCRYLFEHLAETRNDLELVWIGSAEIGAKLPQAPNVRFAQYGTWTAYWHCARAGTCLMSHGHDDLARYPAFRGCRRIYLGHGIAIKNMGSRLEERGGPARRLLRSLWRRPRAVDHWAASSDAHAIKLLAENKSQLVRQSKIMRTGQPRLDPLIAARTDPTSRDKIRARLADRHGLPTDATLISYLPTFRDSGQAVFSFAGLGQEDTRALERTLAPYTGWIAEKSHFAEPTTEEQTRCERPMWLIDVAGDTDLDTQDLLIATDVLVTDYSGCFIDYLLLDRPVIHFAYDYEGYRNKDRGLFFSLAEVAGGDIVSNLPELLKSLSNCLKDPSVNAERRQELRERLLTWEDGTSSPRTATFLFESNELLANEQK